MPREPKPNGRPRFEPTDSQRQIVQVLRSNGIPQRTIAANIGCDLGTLRKRFRVELADGHIQVVAAMGAALVRAGLAGNVNAIKNWLSTHGGPEWRISEGREISGTISSTIDLQQMPLEDLQRELATLRAKDPIH